MLILKGRNFSNGDEFKIKVTATDVHYATCSQTLKATYVSNTN
jgi:hypothetical protein